MSRKQYTDAELAAAVKQLHDAGIYEITEAHLLLVVMMADSEPAKDMRDEIIEVVVAWNQGQLLPKTEAPKLQGLLCMFDPPSPPPLCVVK